MAPTAAADPGLTDGETVWVGCRDGGLKRMCSASRSVVWTALVGSEVDRLDRVRVEGAGEAIDVVDHVGVGETCEV
jgi:hypothetical protein